MNLGAGIDTAAALFPIVHASNESYRSSRRPVRLGNGARLSWARGVARLEFSAPKLLYGHNVQLVESMSLVRELCSASFEEAEDWVHATGGPDTMRLCRLDLARNFTVPSWPPHAMALAPLLRAPRTLASTHRSGLRQDDFGVGIGNHRWAAYAYDKFLESGLTEARNIVRFEYRMMRLVIRAYDVSFDTSMERLNTLCKAAFLNCGFGARVRSQGLSLALRLREAGLSATEEMTLIGALYAAQVGIANRMSATSSRKYRRLASLVGGLASSPDRTRWSRLDYDLGRLMTGLESE
jgi:hypothetical protein